MKNSKITNYLGKRAVLRNQLSHRFIKKGRGIEIGAAQIPLGVLPGVKVLYVDKYMREKIVKRNPSLKDKELVKVDIMDDAEKLEKFNNNSLDFVIANQLIEHCINPLGTLANFLRVLKVGGVIFMAIPDKRRTFDRARPLTSAKHLIEVFKRGYDEDLWEHYEECARLIEELPEDQIVIRVDEWVRVEELSIHVHTFRKENFVNAVNYMKGKGFPLEILMIRDTPPTGGEFIVILRKIGRFRPFINRVIWIFKKIKEKIP